MAYTRTLAELTGQVRHYTDTENAQRPTDSQLESAINASVRALYARLADGGAEFLVTSSTLYTTSGVGEYTLPSDFWQLRSLVWRRAERDVVPLSRFEDRERALLENHRWSEVRPRYRLADVAFGGAPQIEVLPTPDADDYELRVGYIPDPPTINSDLPMTFAPGMDEWVVLDVTCRVLAAEETDVSAWAQLREDVWRNEIVPSLTQRDQARTVAISDHDGDA